MEQAGEGGLGAEFGVRLVREGLESVMAAEVASSIVFAALEQDGGQALPASAHELFQFIRGPLLAVLKRRVGESKAGDAVRAAEELIGKGIAHVKAPPSYQTTMRLPSIVGPVAVLFVSASASVGVRLRASLGGERVTVHVASNIDRALDANRRAPTDVLVIDADGFGQGVSAALHDLVRELPGRSTCVVWGTPNKTKPVLKALKKISKNVLSIDSNAGVDSLLDYVRARRAGPPRPF